jgi:hypothetical protein
MNFLYYSSFPFPTPYYPTALPCMLLYCPPTQVQPKSRPFTLYHSLFLSFLPLFASNHPLLQTLYIYRKVSGLYLCIYWSYVYIYTYIHIYDLIMFYLCMYLFFGATFHRRENYVTFVFLILVNFTLDVFQFHPFTCKWQHFILLCGWVEFHCV